MAHISWTLLDLVSAGRQLRWGKVHQGTHFLDIAPHHSYLHSKITVVIVMVNEWKIYASLNET